MSLSNKMGVQPLGWLRKAWPVGSVFLSVVDTDPATLFGFGTWSQIAGGKFLVGQTASDSDFNAAEETGGSKTSAALLAHTHTVTDPGHNHTQDAHNHTQNAHQHGMAEGTTDGSGNFMDRSNAAAAASALTDAATATNNAATATNQANTTGLTVNSAGSGDSFPILPPYLVLYIWKRTA